VGTAMTVAGRTVSWLGIGAEGTNKLVMASPSQLLQ
jgi:hypothetical protein